MMTTYISFSAEIVPQTTETLIAVLADQVNKKVDEVYLMLSTPGGSVMHGLTLYNVLKGLPLKLIIHNVGNVDSIGNAVFLAGTERYACPQSTFMFHGVGFDVKNAQRLEEKFLRERLDGLLQDQRRIGAVIRQHTNLNDRNIRNLFREARTKDANYALSVGIIHEIRDVKIPTGNPIISLVFQRQGV
jgi:ATP-dependent Clp protease, protease subunit